MQVTAYYITTKSRDVYIVGNHGNGNVWAGPGVERSCLAGGNVDEVLALTTAPARRRVPFYVPSYVAEYNFVSCLKRDSYK